MQIAQNIVCVKNNGVTASPIFGQTTTYYERLVNSIWSEPMFFSPKIQMKLQKLHE